MTSNTSIRDELKKLVLEIESLARDTVVRLNDGDGILDLANEMVKKTSTMTFSLGELHALDSVSPAQVKSATPARHVSVNWYNVRDSCGRFARVIQP